MDDDEYDGDEADVSFGIDPADTHPLCPGWDSFLDGLGDGFPLERAEDIPNTIRTLFVAQAKKADRAIADFRYELQKGAARQDDLAAALTVHRLQTFNAVRMDTDNLKEEMSAVKAELQVVREVRQETELLKADIRVVQADITSVWKLA